MPDKTAQDWSDSDPSFIRTNAADLFNFARRLGMSNDQLREAVDGGLIKPAANAHLKPDHAPVPESGDDPRDRPDSGL